jgi:hypothetical protein
MAAWVKHAREVVEIDEADLPEAFQRRFPDATLFDFKLACGVEDPPAGDRERPAWSPPDTA